MPDLRGQQQADRPAPCRVQVANPAGPALNSLQCSTWSSHGPTKSHATCNRDSHPSGCSRKRAQAQLIIHGHQQSECLCRA